MPARIVVVLNDPAFTDRTVAALRELGSDAVAIHDPMVALTALERARTIEMLIASVESEPGKPNGISVARMVKGNRPGVKVILLGSDTMARFAEGLGTFMPLPCTPSQVALRAVSLLEGGTEPTAA